MSSNMTWKFFFLGVWIGFVRFCELWVCLNIVHKLQNYKDDEGTKGFGDHTQWVFNILILFGEQSYLFYKLLENVFVKVLLN